MCKQFPNNFQSALPFAIISFSLIFSFISSQNVNPKICQTNDCLTAAENLKGSINPGEDPCDNFYLYACGNWPNVHNIPSFMPGSTFDLRSEENDADVFAFLNQNDTKDEPEAVHKARKLYSSCLSGAFFGNKTEPVEIILQQIGLRVHPFLSHTINHFDIASVLAKASRLAGVEPYFDLGVTPNPYNRTVNMIGLSQPQGVAMTITRRTSSRSKRKIPGSIDDEDYISEITKKMCEDSVLSSCKQWSSPFNMIIRYLTSEKIIKQEAEALRIIAKPRLKLNSSAIPIIYTLKQLQSMSDSIANEVHTTLYQKLNWTKYIEETFSGLDNITLDLSDPNKVPIVIDGLDFVKEMLAFIYKIPFVSRVELQIWWNVVSTLLPYADSSIFDLESSTREERCSEIAIDSFGMAVSYLYAKKENYIKAKTEIRKIFESIRKSFAQIIQQVQWMDEITKEKALKKLQSLKSTIAFPSAIKTASKLDDFYRDANITNSFFETMVSKIQKQMTKMLIKLNQMNDLEQDDWTVTPTEVNAFYDPSTNRMIIPAGILGGSIYNGSLRALDYGAIGTIVGHEMTHAFDNTGRRYNDMGNIEDWWQPETANLYREKAKCFVEAYANYSTSLHGITQQVNSTLTLGEDISDSGGFEEALFAYRKSVSVFGKEPLLPKMENFTHEQLFTLSFANLWCENPTLISIFLNKLQDHSPKGVRVNGVLRNSKEFSKIWNCPKGSKMNPSEDKCSIW